MSESFWSHLGVILESSWSHPRVIQESSKSHPRVIQKSLWSHPRVIQSHPSVIRESSKSHPIIMSHSNSAQESPKCLCESSHIHLEVLWVVFLILKINTVKVFLQVDNYEIVVNFFHISRNLT